MELVYIFGSILALACAWILVRAPRIKNVEKVQSIVLPAGSTLLTRETDAETGITQIRYRDKDYNLHAVTYESTLFGYKKVDEQIMRNHNKWKRE